MRVISSISIIYLLLINYNCCEGKKKHKGCDKLLREFASSNGIFTQCAIMHAVPVTMCQDCKPMYENLSSSFHNLTYSNLSCENIYFNKDRLNIVENMYLNSKALWEKAFCSECDNLNETNSISEAIDKVDFCIEKNPALACENCKNDYEAANSNYRSLEKTHSGKICFDIQDKMNETRIKWSKDLKCCRRTANLNTFALLSSLFTFLPILFYGGLVIYTKRRENNQEMLVADLENVNRENTPREICNNSNQMITDDNDVGEPLPSTSFEPSNNSQLPNISQEKLKKTMDSDDDDNDDDDLISLTPNDTYNPKVRQLSQSSMISEIKKKIS